MPRHSTNIVRFTNLSTTGVRTRTFVFRVGQPDYFTELFDAATTIWHSNLTFTPDGSTNFYSVCLEPAASFPTDPAGGTNLTLGSHTYLTLNLNTNISIYGRSTNIIYLASEGHLTLLSGDSSGTMSFANHFSRPRLSASLAHIHPTENGGTVSWLKLSNRVAITFKNVVEYGTTKTNSFQIELFYDGRIRMTHLAMATTTGLVGLSAGNGVPAGFLESDLSSYGACSLPLALSVPATANERDGVLPGQGRVGVASPVLTNLVVNLSSSDTSEATLASSVTILAGQTNVNFDVAIVEDLELDGPQAAIITATAPGYASVSQTIRVEDNETATLSVSLPAVRLRALPRCRSHSRPAPPLPQISW